MEWFRTTHIVTYVVFNVFKPQLWVVCDKQLYSQSYNWSHKLVYNANSLALSSIYVLSLCICIYIYIPLHTLSCLNHHCARTVFPTLYLSKTRPFSAPPQKRLLDFILPRQRLRLEAKALSADGWSFPHRKWIEMIYCWRNIWKSRWFNYPVVRSG